MSGNKNYLYLNRERHWPDFHSDGLELRDDGSLQLSSVPLLEGELPEGLANLGTPALPAGIAVAPDGTIYYSDPSKHLLMKIDGCDSRLAPIACVGGKGTRPGQLNTPRGLLIPQHRPALFVADSANHRLEIFDLNAYRLLDIWGQENFDAAPHPGSAPGQLDTPTALAADGAGNIYVVDAGNKRVQKFNVAGDVVSKFWDRLEAEHILSEPRDIAVDWYGETTHLYVIDKVAQRIFVVGTDGHALRDEDGQPVSFGLDGMDALGIAVTADAVYVGDNARRRVLGFRKANGFVFAGEAVGYHGPVAALALDGKGYLLVHSGTGLAPVRLTIGKGYRTAGHLWSEPIRPGVEKVNWHRLRAEMQRLDSNAHLHFFIHTSNDESQSPPAPSLDTHGGDPFAGWSPVAIDVTDFLIEGEDSCCLWVGALFTGDGSVTPVVSQLRVEFNHVMYADYLPAIYRKETPCTDFLVRLLALFESFFGEVEDEIAGLPALFDALVVPANYLGWLASWLALELDEDWDEAMKRRVIGDAFEAYARRGTAEGLRQSLRVFAGVDAVIEEPILSAAWWALPGKEEGCEPQAPCPEATEQKWRATENSLLGVTTMLAPAEAQGAVVGTTALLDGSYLITDEEFGTPLFEDVAHQFSVQIYRGQLKCAETLPQVRALIEREKPAHTAYHLCIIEPRMRVGFQSRIGIDTVVAGPPSGMRLGEGLVLGAESVLGGQPAGRIGKGSQVGVTTRVG
jgi:phage tail-like protein